MNINQFMKKYSSFITPATGIFEVTVTKEMARDLLEANCENNRHVKDIKVGQYVDLVNSGNWDAYKGDLVRIAETKDHFVMIDGQHRAEARTKSDKDFSVLMCFDFETGDFKYIDAGTSRNGSDMLRGTKNSNLKAALASLITNFNKFGLNKSTFKLTPTNSEIYESYTENHEFIDDSISRWNRAYRKGLFSGSIAGYAFCEYLLKNNIRDGLEEKSKEFVEEMLSEMVVSEQISLFRSWNNRRQRQKGTIDKLESFIAIATAWKYFATDVCATKIVVSKSKKPGKTTLVDPVLYGIECKPISREY